MTDNPQPGLPARLEAVLTERFTELGNPFSRMAIAFKGPDGWPASREVGPHDVAEVLRELMADEAQQPETQTTPCSQPNACEDGGDPCTTHEREQAHADGDHGLCGNECTAGQPSLDGALRIVSDWVIESNDSGGIDADDLTWRLAQAGYPLPDDEA
ncbi:hypothetical protein [Streptomyces mirabilis]|uniref:hypothetical protein n=1 Tax=Streptomyces mirabilis TaxID=68239 RepID=UPI0033F476D6